MDALGSLATQGHKVLARQALFGGDYELIDRGSFTPNPDYWLAFLWPRLMGTRVLRLANPAGNRTGLRAYAHCGLVSAT
jgi:heparanase 1